MIWSEVEFTSRKLRVDASQHWMGSRLPPTHRAAAVMFIPPPPPQEVGIRDRRHSLYQHWVAEQVSARATSKWLGGTIGDVYTNSIMKSHLQYNTSRIQWSLNFNSNPGLRESSGGSTEPSFGQVCRWGWGISSIYVSFMQKFLHTSQNSTRWIWSVAARGKKHSILLTIPNLRISWNNIHRLFWSRRRNETASFWRSLRRNADASLTTLAPIMFT
jgi:hypothetical protein